MEPKTTTNTTNHAGTAVDQRQVWLRTQREYQKWTNTPLPKHYLQNIVDIGERFKHFIGKTGTCLDIGCGNGLISGQHYETVGYSYLDKGAVGVDPLPLMGYKPKWLREYTRGVCEHLAFKDECFDTLVFATTLDHVQDLDACMTECKRVLKKKGALNIWLTCPYFLIKKSAEAHPNRLTEETLEALLLKHGFRVADKFASPFWGLSRSGDQVSSGNTVFVKCAKMD